MAQAMMVMCGFSGHAGAANPLKKQPLLLSQIQKIRPSHSESSHLFFSPLPSPPPSRSLRTFAVFRSKTKAPPAKKVEKPKKRIEDGIFGTSGGIGFTKQNELFVGRVAMLGFAGQEDSQTGGANLFRQGCIGRYLGCHPFRRRSGEEHGGHWGRIYKVTYAGVLAKPRGCSVFGEQSAPIGQCTFGPRLKDEEIRLLAQFFKLQAQH